MGLQRRKGSPERWSGREKGGAIAKKIGVAVILIEATIERAVVAARHDEAPARRREVVVMRQEVVVLRREVGVPSRAFLAHSRDGQVSRRCVGVQSRNARGGGLDGRRVPRLFRRDVISLRRVTPLAQGLVRRLARVPQLLARHRLDIRSVTRVIRLSPRSQRDAP
jgi:hypothetical protein